VILERVESNPYLAEFYSDMNAWALQTQMHFLTCRHSQYIKALNAVNSTVLDRSVYDDANVFVPALRETGHLSEQDYQQYREVFQHLAGRLRPPDAIIYLRGSPEKMLDRIRKRGRRFEQSIGLEYLNTKSPDA
jgi:deoxyadenosine/deoxycytidine kinase